MDLAKKIKKYYFDNLEELPKDKQFHFATRLAAWENEPMAIDILIKLKDYIYPGEEHLDDVVKELLKLNPHKGINAFSERKPFFDKYKGLYGIHAALFRIRHLKSIYGIDAKSSLFKRFTQKELDDLAERLISNKDALKTLSTYAVNFIYLYKDILMGQPSFIDLNYLTELVKNYDLNDPKQIQLLIYLYTHCIIGASNFYTREISQKDLEAYRNMLSILEPIIKKDFKNINLDNKLEFLVCSRICGYESGLFAKVHEECHQSLSDRGDFLIDRHNNNAQKNRISLDKSEHRNVLYIMSCSAYKPNSTLV